MISSQVARDSPNELKKKHLKKYPLRWEEIPPMSYARASPAVAASNGKIYAIGRTFLILDAYWDILVYILLKWQQFCDNGFGYCNVNGKFDEYQV